MYGVWCKIPILNRKIYSLHVYCAILCRTSVRLGEYSGSPPKLFHYRTLFDSNQLKNEKSTTMPKFCSTETEKVSPFVLKHFGTAVRVSIT